MKVSAINVNSCAMLHANSYNNKKGLSSNISSSLLKEQNDNIVFKAKAGKILGKVAGAATGAAAGGAIIGGGSLATGIAMLSGPIGWAALGAAYFIGGALAGGYIGDGLGDVIEDKINENSKD